MGWGCRNETFSFSVGPSSTKIYVKVLDHKTLGKDKALGEGEVDVCNLQSVVSVTVTDFLFRFGGTSNLRAMALALMSCSNFEKAKANFVSNSSSMLEHRWAVSARWHP